MVDCKQIINKIAFEGRLVMGESSIKCSNQDTIKNLFHDCFKYKKVL